MKSKTTRTVISVSKKKSPIRFNPDELPVLKHTEMVVYKTRVGKKLQSITKHEVLR